MQRIRDLSNGSVARLIQRYGLDLETVPAGEAITGSYWGEPEAGIVGNTIYVRGDTPVHSVLHEASHVICMSPDRRASLDRDAGGDDLEECAVCFFADRTRKRATRCRRETTHAGYGRLGLQFSTGQCDALV